VNVGGDPNDTTIFAFERQKDGEVREGHTALIGVFYGEDECLGGISASVVPPEDEPGDNEAKTEEDSNDPADD
jgi:hypothetical protein